MDLLRLARRAADDAIAMSPDLDTVFLMRSASPEQYMDSTRRRLADLAVEELRKAGGGIDAATLAGLIRSRVAEIAGDGE